ncbi:MAG: LysR family transcriptional regulator [Bryobacterales bacterium]|nr:LysR family transcriptional regulator [Bryobacterales bacterium]
MIELIHLRYFIALAEELHYGRAAERLHMAQPPLTRQIKLLEERLGCRLFDRTTRSTRLTPAGEQFLAKARAIVAQADEAFDAAAKAGRGEEGQLTLATAPSLMLGFLPRVIRAFRRKYPDVNFRLHETASSEILKALRNGSADLGLLRGADRDTQIQTLLRWKEPMVAILPPDHTLARAGGIKLAQLKGEPFVLFPRHVGPAFHDDILRHCLREGFTPMIVQEARQWPSIIALVSAGMGVSVGPETVRDLLPRTASFSTLQGFTTTVRIAAAAGTATNPALHNFMQLVRKHRPAT